jgi:hypothetical protein
MGLRELSLETAAVVVEIGLYMEAGEEGGGVKLLYVNHGECE